MSASFITQFGSTTTETISNFAITSDGSFLFVGRTLKSWSGVTVIEPYDAGDDIYVAKYNPATKSVEWITYLGSGPGAGQDYGYDIAVDGNDDFAVVGSVGGSLAHHGAISTNGNGVIAKFNAAGELQWLTHAGAPEGSAVFPRLPLTPIITSTQLLVAPEARLMASANAVVLIITL